MVITSDKKWKLLVILLTWHKIKYRFFFSFLSAIRDKLAGENIYKNKYFHLNSLFEKDHTLS